MDTIHCVEQERLLCGKEIRPNQRLFHFYSFLDACKFWPDEVCKECRQEAEKREKDPHYSTGRIK